MVFTKTIFFIKVLILAYFYNLTKSIVSSLGSMSSVAVSHGENGPVFCALNSDGSHSVTCYGADNSIVYGAPTRLPFLGLTAGDSFVCGLLLDSKQPFCWGSNFYVKMGVPQPMEENAAYSSISAGDQHLCGLRIPTNESHSLIDCWGYNMTASHEFGGRVSSITAGSVFNCGLFEHSLSAFCFGDEMGSNVISLIPRGLSFQSISAGGFHVCGVLENFQVFCWGKSVGISRDDVELVPMDPMILVVGGRFHACGIRSIDRGINCWGLSLPNSVPPPKDLKVYEMAAGDYFTCGVAANKSLTPHCWGAGGLGHCQWRSLLVFVLLMNVVWDFMNLTMKAWEVGFASLPILGFACLVAMTALKGLIDSLIVMSHRIVVANLIVRLVGLLSACHFVSPGASPRLRGFLLFSCQYLLVKLVLHLYWWPQFHWLHAFMFGTSYGNVGVLVLTIGGMGEIEQVLSTRGSKSKGLEFSLTRSWRRQRMDSKKSYKWAKVASRVFSKGF